MAGNLTNTQNLALGWPHPSHEQEQWRAGVQKTFSAQVDKSIAITAVRNRCLTDPHLARLLNTVHCGKCTQSASKTLRNAGHHILGRRSKKKTACVEAEKEGGKNKIVIIKKLELAGGKRGKEIGKG